MLMFKLLFLQYYERQKINQTWSVGSGTQFFFSKMPMYCVQFAPQAPELLWRSPWWLRPPWWTRWETPPWRFMVPSLLISLRPDICSFPDTYGTYRTYCKTIDHSNNRKKCSIVQNIALSTE